MCRIAWGRVDDIMPVPAKMKNPALGVARVKYDPLKFDGKKFFLGKETVRQSFLADKNIKAGDNVSLHWEYICDKITPRQKNNLVFWTKYHLNLANKTI